MWAYRGNLHEQKGKVAWSLRELKDGYLLLPVKVIAPDFPINSGLCEDWLKK